MRNALTAVLLALIGLAPAGASAQSENFEDLVRDALQPGTPSAGQDAQQRPASAVPPRIGVQPAPLEPGAPPPAAPVGPPAPTPPALDAQNPAPSRTAAPAEPPAAPRPYTPPRREAPAPDAAAGEPPLPAAPGTAATPVPGPATAERSQASLGVDEVNAATFSAEAQSLRGANPLVLKAQILLDRAGASPGVIDGIYGGNVAKAIAAVETVLGLPVDGQLDAQVWAALGGDEAPPVLIDYVITAEDAAYPFLPSIPADYAIQATLPALGFTSPDEMFGERFHMDVKLIRALNPNADLRAAGTRIVVADVQGQTVTGKIARIEADKRAKQVRAYDAENRLVVAYPATIGSSDNPSPSGTHLVNTTAPNPIYYYNPDNFVQGANRQKLELPPGPNNPVGTMWIDLSEPSYGIHGTPEPSRIDKTGSHGCIRLTNWDVEELATLVSPGIPVSFTE